MVQDKPCLKDVSWNISKINFSHLIPHIKFFSSLKCLVLFLFSFSSYTQEIKGKVKDDLDQPIAGINVLVKRSSSDKTVFKYAVSDEKGNYSISLGSELDSFVIKFTSFVYKTKVIEIIEFSQKSDPYMLNVILDTDLTKLEEVIVKSKKKHIEIKNDTTFYDISKFRDGTERVIEDLLKKLPGIKVKEDGKLTFKGKNVESVLLDGDDLFDTNYTIGTKNISIDMIDGLSAIENFNKNPILQGIEDTEAVAINLKLKPGKTDFSNTTNIGLGVERKTDINTNLLGVSQKHKSFSTASFNNIGKEYSPYNLFSSNNSSTVDSKDEKLHIARIIQDGSFTSDISEERSRIGNNFFTSVNSIFNFTKKLKGKINLDYKNDKFEQSIINQTEYLNINNTTDIFQREFIEKKPDLFNAKLDLEYKFSEIELLRSETKVLNQDANTLLHIDLNDFLQSSRGTFENKQILQKFNFTKRLNNNSALSSDLLLNKTKLSQNLYTTPDLRFSDTLSISHSNQLVEIEKSNVHFNAFYLQSGKDYNLKLGAGFTFEETAMFSLLTYRNSDSTVSSNNLTYSNMYPWLDVSLFYKLNKWSFRPSLQTRYLFQEYADLQGISEDRKDEKYQFLPKINITYSFNKISNIALRARYDEKQVSEDHLYEEVIFTSNRGARKNTATLAPLKSYDFELQYNYNDFFNLFQFHTGINYSLNKNNYYDNIEINSLFTYNSIKMFDDGSKNFGANANIDKYVGFLKSNIKFNLSYNLGSYKNIINDSEFRDNRISSILSDLNVKTGFLGIINFENNFRFRKSIFHANLERNIQSTAFQNSFKLYLKPHKQIRLSANFDYYVPDLNNFQSFAFFDTSLTFTSKNGNIAYSILSKNITPNKSIFKRTELNDYSFSTSSYRLQQPYLLFSVNFKL